MERTWLLRPPTDRPCPHKRMQRATELAMRLPGFATSSDVGPKPAEANDQLSRRSLFGAMHKCLDPVAETTPNTIWTQLLMTLRPSNAISLQGSTQSSRAVRAFRRIRPPDPLCSCDEITYSYPLCGLCHSASILQFYATIRSCLRSDHGLSHHKSPGDTFN